MRVLFFFLVIQVFAFSQISNQNIVLHINNWDTDVVINEIMASNDNYIADEFGEYDDWIEIYNKGSQAIDLSNYHLSDDVDNLGKYSFPNIILGPNEYFIVWADDDEEDQGDYNHATFKLSASGEEVYLSDENFNILDGFTFGAQDVDMGYARVPNGIGNFVIQNPTFSANNDQLSIQLEFKKNQKIQKIVDVLGRHLNQSSSKILLYIYANGTIEKKIIIE